MQDLQNVKAQPPPANLQQIHRSALNFRKLMLLFPYVHPAALHAVIVKNNFNWEPILHILFAGEGARAEQFWDEVNNGHRELEDALKRRGVRLVCCNGFRENQCASVQQDEMKEPQTARPPPNCINIIIEQNPQPNGTAAADNVAPKTNVYEVETPANDVIRIILGRRNEGLVVNNTKKAVEVVRNTSVNNQATYIIRNVTDTSESAPKQVQTVKRSKRVQQRTDAIKSGEKQARSRKPKVVQSEELTNEQNATCGAEVKIKTEPATSKKGKASSNTRVKSSKNKNNNHNKSR